MKKIIGLLAAAGMMLGLASCGNGAYRTAKFNYAENVPLEACDSMALAVDHSFVYFKSVKAGQEVCDKLNAEIVSVIFGDNYRDETIGEASRAYLEGLEESYQKDAGSDYRDLVKNGEQYPGAYCNWENSLTGNFSTSYREKYITYTVNISLYYGGVHGSNTVWYRILNLETGDAVTEDDIFAPGYKEAVSELLVDGIREKYEAMEDGRIYLEDIFFDDVCPNGNVAISEEGLTWTFNAYEIAPYYIGAIDVLIPWTKLSGNLSNEFNID
jgi:hypothetical protein